jgi:flavin reductase (DIM6/NTAB) family NADH-FMN oxidoreductase RutF
VEAAKSFAVSLLAADQEDVAKRFAAKERATGRAQFAGVPHHLSAFGPMIDTAAAALGCRLHGLHSGSYH